jgi:hypothetical protein
MDRLLINHVCSLGPVCQSSKLCKDVKLKQESYPFDWIFSCMSYVKHMIEDDFSMFLNKDLYVYNSHCKSGHQVYGSSMFNHHIPNIKDEDYMYFVRCVQRFRKLLLSDSNKLFVIIYPNCSSNPEEIETNKKSILELNEFLLTKTKNMYVFAIYHMPNQAEYKEVIEDMNNIKYIQLFTKHPSDGTCLIDKNENKLLQELLLNSYKFQVKKLE